MYVDCVRLAEERQKLVDAELQEQQRRREAEQREKQRRQEHDMELQSVVLATYCKFWFLTSPS